MVATPSSEWLRHHLRRGRPFPANATTDEADGMVSFEAAALTDPMIAEQERERIFGRVPSIVCHASELLGRNEIVDHIFHRELGKLMPS